MSTSGVLTSGTADFRHVKISTVIAHSAVNHVSKISKMESDDKKTYLVWGPNRSVLPDKYAYKFAKRMFHNYKKTIKVYIVKSEKYFDTIWELQNKTPRNATRTWLSTGFFSVVTALNICNQITLFGFVRQNYCDGNNTQHKAIRIQHGAVSRIRTCAGKELLVKTQYQLYCAVNSLT
ncbi:alpha-N-acetylgalactosaminide alpha-2,6-sialyltransferase 5-like [Convolutriloba macropyga]|uniref:alpha-N-acetylgalactosaminide alpha-2,6-sialyltransferase 5-like n=1 Tax=Convolutriloba macropyga TaxID=536237 RepID=UPI003F521C84